MSRAGPDESGSAGSVLKEGAEGAEVPGMVSAAEAQEATRMVVGTRVTAIPPAECQLMWPPLRCPLKTLQKCEIALEKLKNDMAVVSGGQGLTLLEGVSTAKGSLARGVWRGEVTLHPTPSPASPASAVVFRPQHEEGNTRMGERLGIHSKLAASVHCQGEGCREPRAHGR